VNVSNWLTPLIVTNIIPPKYNHHISQQHLRWASGFRLTRRDTENSRDCPFLFQNEEKTTSTLIKRKKNLEWL
jgi:hypothetical protein